MGAPAGDLDGLMNRPWWLLTIDQLNSMIVDPSVLGEFGRQVQREHVREVSILGGDLCRSLFGYQAGYLRSTG